MRLHEQPVPERRREPQGVLRVLRQPAAHPRSGHRLLDHGPRRDRTDLRHAARVPLPEAPLRAHSRARRVAAEQAARRRRRGRIPLPPAPRPPLPGRRLLRALRRRTADAYRHRRRRRLRDRAPRRPGGQQPGGRELRQDPRVRAVRRHDCASGAPTTLPSPLCAPTASTPWPGASPACACSARSTSRSSSINPTRRSSTGSRCPSRRRCRGRRWRTTTARTGGRLLAEHAVGTGPFRLARYEQAQPHHARAQPGLVRHRGIRSGARPRRSTRARASRTTRRTGCSTPDVVGRPLPFVDRIEMRCEKESIPAFTKFLQGYYDRSRIPKESFDARRAGRRAVAARWRRSACGSSDRRDARPSTTSASTWTDPVVGAAGGERARKLRQAMSLADRHRRVPARVPERARHPGAVAAAARSLRLRRRLPQPVPPASISTARARCSPRRATRTASIPRHGRALRLTFDTGDTSVQSQLQLPVPGRVVAAPRARRRDRRHALQPVPGQGAARRLPDLLLGMGGRLSRIPRTSCSCSAGRWGRRASGGPNIVQLRRPALRRALRAACETRDNDAERGAVIGAMRAHARASSGRGSSSSTRRTTRSPRAGCTT